MLALIKKKRSGKIKGRIIADGRRQRGYMKKGGCGIAYSKFVKFFDYISD